MAEPLSDEQLQRLTQKIGVLTTQQMHLIAATIAFCIGYNPPQPPSASSK
jgi:hypothetical protein